MRRTRPGRPGISRPPRAPTERGSSRNERAGRAIRLEPKEATARGRRSERRLALRRLEDIAHAAERLQVHGRGGVLLDLLTQAVDELLEELAVAEAAMPPDVGRELVDRLGSALVGEQELEEAQLEAREAH